jgi:hypothetical protein
LAPILAPGKRHAGSPPLRPESEPEYRDVDGFVDLVSVVGAAVAGVGAGAVPSLRER